MKYKLHIKSTNEDEFFDSVDALRTTVMLHSFWNLVLSVQTNHGWEELPQHGLQAVIA